MRHVFSRRNGQGKKAIWRKRFNGPAQVKIKMLQGRHGDLG
ncbi:MAG: hypothetical protein ACYDDI_15710 [Candidatus Acidiferrales bacterium]